MSPEIYAIQAGEWAEMLTWIRIEILALSYISRS